MENGDMKQGAKRWHPAGAFYLIVLFWVPWFTFSMVGQLIRSSYLKMNAEAPVPAGAIVTLFDGHHPAAWALALAGVLLPLWVLLTPADKWRRGIMVSATLAIVVLMSLGALAAGVAVAAVATIASS